MSGTGDFRIALLDTSPGDGDGNSTSSTSVVRENWCPEGIAYKNMTACVEADPFASMKGYDFRIFPHLTAKARHLPGQVPCSIYRKSSANLFGKSPRLGEWGCFGTELGVFTELSLWVEMTNATSFKVGMRMNGITYEARDSLDTNNQSMKAVSAIAIGCKNGCNCSKPIRCIFSRAIFPRIFIWIY